MTIFRPLLVALAVICAQEIATPQTVIGRSFISGFESGTMGEGVARGGSVQSTIVRSGGYAYRANPVNSNQFLAFQSRSAGGVLRPIFQSSRFYIYVAKLPAAGSVSIVKIGGSVTYNPEVDLNSDGTLTLADSWHAVIARSTQALSADGSWHRVEFDVGSGLGVYVDGALWAKGGTTSYPAGIAISFGAGESPTFINATADLYFDDVLVDGNSFSVTGFPGDGHALLLRPTLDPSALDSWQDGAGSTSNLWTAVKNNPPAGHASSAATNTSQIKNLSHSNNMDYKPSVQSYVDAGVPLNAVINAVMAVGNDGQDGKNGATGGIWIAGNPAQAAGGYSFDFGDGAGAVGAFPYGWATHYGPVSANPAVSLVGPPIVAARKASGAGVDVDFLGVYVDYK